LHDDGKSKRNKAEPVRVFKFSVGHIIIIVIVVGRIDVLE